MLNFFKFSHSLVRSIKHKYSFSLKIPFLFYHFTYHENLIGESSFWFETTLVFFEYLFRSVYPGTFLGTSVRVVMIFLWRCLNLSWFLSCRSVW